jgi:hypothetical protein
MTTADHLTVPGTIANISKAGLMIECNRQTIEDLIPRESTPSPKTPVRLEILFTLKQQTSIRQQEPLEQGQKTQTDLFAICNIIHVRRISRDVYHIGVEFLVFPNDDYAVVAQYVESRLQQ